MVKVNTNNDLERLEKKAASVIYQDGIFDMMLGHVMIAFGIGMLVSDRIPDPMDGLLGFIIYLAIFIPLVFIQMFITKPRLGVAKFGLKRKRKSMVVIAIVTVILLSNIVLLILTITDVLQFGGHEYLAAALFGLIPLVIFTIMAYFLDFTRLYLIGPLFSIGLFLKEFLTLQNYELYSNIVFISIGVIIVSTGLVFLFRFLKKYPKVEVESNEYKGISD